MSEDVFVVAYDGAEDGVVSSAIEHAKKQGARLHVVHVLEWSPYTFLTPEEIEHRHQQREADFARANESVLAPALDSVRAAGVDVSGEVRFGNIPDVVSEIAQELNARLIFVKRSSSLSARLLGSAASGLAQSATVPVVIVP